MAFSRQDADYVVPTAGAGETFVYVQYLYGRVTSMTLPFEFKYGMSGIPLFAAMGALGAVGWGLEHYCYTRLHYHDAFIVVSMILFCAMGMIALAFTVRPSLISLTSASITVTPCSMFTGNPLSGKSKSISVKDVTKVVISAGGRDGVSSIQLKDTTTGREVGFLVPSFKGLTIRGLALDIGKAYGKPVVKLGLGSERLLSS